MEKKMSIRALYIYSMFINYVQSVFGIIVIFMCLLSLVGLIKVSLLWIVVGIYLLFYVFVLILRAKHSAYIDGLLLSTSDLNRFESYNETMVEKAMFKNHLLFTYLRLVKINFYKGNFEKSKDYASKINRSKIKKIIRFQLTNSLLTFLLKDALLSQNFTEYNSLYQQMNDIETKNESQRAEITLNLNLCKAIEDIISRKTPNNFFDNWKVDSKIYQLEKTYFQALNEQLKGNDDKAKEFFEQLSQENPDLFFVKEAKKYLENN